MKPTPLREQAIDEGGIGTMANLRERRYTPGKPKPNHVEFIAAVGSDDWVSNITWTGDITKKYGRAEKKLPQIEAYIKYFTEIHGKHLQPHIFYIDARWGSLALMKVIDQAQMYGVLSCSAKSKPQTLFTWMREGLDKGQWRSVGCSAANANLVTVHTKKKVYLNIMTNYATVAAQSMRKRRRKPPSETYSVNAPWAQQNYNKWKCKVDQWNKALSEYSRTARYTDSAVMYTQFFIHAYMLQSYTYWKATTGTCVSQLNFRRDLLEELKSHLESQGPPPQLPSKALHWPVHMEGLRHRCQYPHCRNSCTHRCHVCDKWGCLPCLQEAHRQLTLSIV